MKDGTYLGGVYGRDSFTSSYPEPNAVFLQEAWPLKENGAFEHAPVSGSRGVWIKCDDVRAVEFLAAEDATGKDEWERHAQREGSDE
jgi:hypothetical protein